MEEIKIKNLYNLENTIAKNFLEKYDYPWECLQNIADFIIEYGKSLDKNLFLEVKENVWIAKNAKISDMAYIEGPTIIDEFAEIRHCAFIRGKAIIGKKCVIGNSTEIKNSIIFDGAQIPHFNYVGDSILGWNSHLGAGAITSNLKNDKKNVIIKFTDGTEINTKLRKMGAMIGDFADIGCNTVLNPGAIIGKNTTIYPLNSVRGVIEENSIYKEKNNIVKKY